MKRYKWRIIFALLGVALGFVVGQLVIILLETSGGVILARDIIGCTYGIPAMGGYLGWMLSE